MSDKPSSLATKLAQHLFKGDDKRAIDIDNVLSVHRYDEFRRIRDESKLLPSFCENISVLRARDRNEFFELQLLPPEPGNDYEVQFKRQKQEIAEAIFSGDYDHIMAIDHEAGEVLAFPTV
jgi:hypothetical protein